MTEPAGAPLPVPDVHAPEELYPIREVSRLTGVHPVTLRAWERRYGLIQPVRTDSGHRLYSPADIEAVRSILAWIQRGVPVSKVGGILNRAVDSSAGGAPVYREVAAGEWSEWQARVRLALGRFDEAQLERVYGQVFSTYPPAVVFLDVLLPVWRELQVRRGEFGRTSEWLLLDAFLRARVLSRLQLAPAPDGGRLLLAAVPGQCQELELLVAGLLLGGDSVAVGVLPIGQPLEELPLVCERVRPPALVLYSDHAPGQELARQLGRLALAVECPLALAGEAAGLGERVLAATPVACLGALGRDMPRRLAQFLAGRLDA